jgi:hypothetical protein
VMQRRPITLCLQREGRTSKRSASAAFNSNALIAAFRAACWYGADTVPMYSPRARSRISSHSTLRLRSPMRA